MNEDSLNIAPETIILASAGDEESFREIYTVLRQALRPFATKLSNSQQEAEDILQEVFIRIWLHRDQLPEIENLRSWAFTILSRVAYTFIRRKLNMTKKLNAFQYQAPNKEEEDPFQLLHYQQLNNLINEFITLMPPQRRLIFQMSRTEGMKPSAIAAQLGLSVGTVKNVLSRTLADIRLHLASKGYVFSSGIFVLLKIF